MLFLYIAIILSALWLFDLLDFGTSAILKIVIFLTILFIMGYVIGIGIYVAHAGETEKRCQQIGQLICNDVIKTYESNSYNNIAIIQRAGVLQDLYIDMGCQTDFLATCIIIDLNFKEEK